MSRSWAQVLGAPGQPTALLPAALERRRGAVPVVDALPVKARPTTRVAPGRDQLRTLEHLHARSDVLAHVSIGDGEGYALVDKATPHGLYEVMVISAAHRVLAGLHQHSPRFHTAFGALVVAFVAHCRQHGLYPTLGWSYDPDTGDRESIQGEKRFHAHLIGRSPNELAFIGAHAKPAARCPQARRRRLCEEAAVIGALLAGDLLDRCSLRAVEPVAPLSCPTATISVQVRLRDGWAAFDRPSLFANLAVLHATFQRAYTAILEACWVGVAGRWQRPRVRSDPERLAAIGLPLGPTTRAALGHYLRALRPELLERRPAGFWQHPANRAVTTHVYPLAGLAYAVGFAEHAGQVYGYLRPSVFSDLGGAGAQVVNGVVVKIRRGAEIMDRRELAARNGFQRGYLDRLQSGQRRPPASLQEPSRP